MPNVRNNNYAKNNYESYNASVLAPTKIYYINGKENQVPNNNNPYAQYEFKHLLTGGNTSGNVWVNSGYDIAKNDPGISWTL